MSKNLWLTITWFRYSKFEGSTFESTFEGNTRFVLYFIVVLFVVYAKEICAQRTLDLICWILLKALSLLESLKVYLCTSKTSKWFDLYIRNTQCIRYYPNAVLFCNYFEVFCSHFLTFSDWFLLFSESQGIRTMKNTMSRRLFIVTWTLLCTCLAAPDVSIKLLFRKKKSFFYIYIVMAKKPISPYKSLLNCWHISVICTYFNDVERFFRFHTQLLYRNRSKTVIYIMHVKKRL